MQHQNKIQTAIDQLKKGEIVAIPTETVYGLAADATNIDAVKKIFEIKGRPESTAISLLIPDHSSLERWAKKIPNIAKEWAKQYWPGPLTLIFEKKEWISDTITGGKSTIGLRCPDHEVTQAILKHFPNGLAAPSANPYGKTPPTNAEMVRAYFHDEILIVDGGESNIGLSSTVADLSCEPPKILRQGSVRLF